MESRRSGQLVVHVISLPADVFSAIDERELLRLERALVLPLRFKKSRRVPPLQGRTSALSKRGNLCTLVESGGDLTDSIGGIVKSAYRNETHQSPVADGFQSGRCETATL